MTIQKNFKLSMAAIAASLLVAACGGGGGGSTSAGTAAPASSPDAGSSPAGTPSGASTPTGTTPSTGVAPATTVPAATYDGSSFQAAAFALVNNYRASMGVGTLKQDPVLDTAAQAHALYLFSNLKARTIPTLDHNEIAGNLNYYADTPLARAQKAGAPTTEYIGESIAANVSQLTTAAAAADCIGQNLASVYHLAGLTFTQETVGIGYMPGDSTWAQYTCSLEYGTLTGVSGAPLANANSYSGGQQIATNAVVHSPFTNEAGVRTAMVPEAPNPASDLTAPGRPIMVRVNAENRDTLSVSQFTLTDAAGTQVAARILVPASAQASSTATTVADPNNALPNGTAILLPLSPLRANTTYTVTFNGARDGVALPATTWSFTTAAQ
ncbi:CAP domain-containing protein [Caballeronia sp. LZ032]|uniref:CAP domain-containing protein n=1 Tax=Caballeronia sp. LZ032 TaxID=3038565 RepID=UPI002865AC4A|nr:CAP domain-containing protein [Caballeronia sp. LZ032]MDR5884115.1 CAP domain-containing protein [Caballeronia sp. LZ032]